MSDWWTNDPVADSKPAAGPSPYAGAISSIESGGRYDIMGPATRTGDRAHGKYQIMGANIGPWTKEVFGQEMTPQQFIASPEAQDAVFNAKFGTYVQKYGPEGAAKAWFAGEKGMHNPNGRDVLGTSVTDYAAKFNKATGRPTDMSAQARPQTTQQPAGDWWASDPVAPAPQPGQVESRFGEMQAPSAGEPALQAGLERAATNLTTGEQQSPTAQMAVEQRNLLSGAQQGTSPHADQYGGKLVSRETFESDSGDVMYRDPSTGEVKPTNTATQVAIRDPKDGVIKIYERSAGTNESGATGAARVLAPGLAAGAATARPAIPAVKNMQPKASDIFATSKPHYREFTKEASKVEVPVETAAGFADRLRKSLDSVNLDVEMAGKPAAAALKMLESGEPLTLDYLQRVKRFAGRGFGSAEKDVRDGAAAITKEINKIIGEVSPNAAKALKTADDIHSTALAVQDLQRKSDVAGLRASRTGYGGNSVNTMRQEIGKIVQRSVEGKTTMLKPDELAAAREIVEGNTATNALRLVGQVSPSKGIMNTGAGSAGGAFALGPVGAVAIPALGAAANKLATILTGKQIDHLKSMVAKRSPEYAKAVARATEKYERAQMELVNNPSPAKFAAYLSASRALSSGLQRDGVQISSGDLIRQLQQLQGPSKAAAAADGDEQQGPGLPSQ